MRFASLKSPNPAVRARLQAALFTNRKRNKARREAGQESNIWGSPGSITVAEDTVNGGWGYNSYEAVGSVVSPDPAFPILCLYMLDGDSTIYLDIQGYVFTLLADATITIKGQTFPIGGFSFVDPVSTTSFPTVLNLISSADNGQVIPFTINLA